MLAAYLTPTQPSRAKALWLGGQDVIKDSVNGNWGVPIETVTVTAAGPGGISSMTFRLDDPANSIAVALYMVVTFYDHTLNYPIFTGYVTAFDFLPDFGQQGRSIAITATGVEALLDWAILPAAVTIPIFTQADSAFMAVVNAATGVGPLRAFGGSGFNNGSQAFPIGGLAVSAPLAADITIPAGTNLREALRSLAGVIYGPVGFGSAGAVAYVIDVDFYYGLRIWLDGGTNAPSDYAAETITESTGIRAENLAYSVDGTDVPSGVFVLPTGAPSNAAFVGGTLTIGPKFLYNDTTSVNPTQAAAVGAAYLTQFTTGVRGSYEQSDRAASSTVHPGSITTITNLAVGLAAVAYRIAAIEKTFNSSGRENWTVSFGGLQPSAARLIRRLTLGANA